MLLTCSGNVATDFVGGVATVDSVACKLKWVGGWRRNYARILDKVLGSLELLLPAENLS